MLTQVKRTNKIKRTIHLFIKDKIRKVSKTERKIAEKVKNIKEEKKEDER